MKLIFAVLDVSLTMGLTRCYKTEGFFTFIIVKWWSGNGGIQALSERPNGFLQCFDTVGLVI